MTNPNLIKLAQRLGNEELPRESAKPKPIQVSTSLEGINLGDYVFIPQHNLYVAKETSYHNKSWYDAHKALHQENTRMLTIREFIDFLSLLKTGDVRNGLEQRMPEDEVLTIYNNITEKRSPWRAEWLDADFKVINDNLHINYNHRTINGQLKPQKTELLQNCLMENCYVDLSSCNNQGLPTKKSRKEDVYYWRPSKDNNSVAWFVADSVRAYLVCVGDPQGSNSGLGVRVAREK